MKTHPHLCFLSPLRERIRGEGASSLERVLIYRRPSLPLRIFAGCILWITFLRASKKGDKEKVRISEV
jgi:hypothetical protein